MVKNKLLHIAILSALSLPIMAHAATTQEQIQQKQQQIEANNVKINNYKTELVPYNLAESEAPQVVLKNVKFYRENTKAQTLHVSFDVANNSNYPVIKYKVEFKGNGTDSEGLKTTVISETIGNGTSVVLNPGAIASFDQSMAVRTIKKADNLFVSDVTFPALQFSINNNKYMLIDGVSSDGTTLKTNIAKLETQNQKLEQEIAELSSN